MLSVVIPVRSDLFYTKEISQNVVLDRLLKNVSLFVKSLRGTCCAAFYLWLIPGALEKHHLQDAVLPKLVRFEAFGAQSCEE